MNTSEGNTMNTEAKPTVVRVEDCEYEGTCTMCGRENVRWIVIFDDGSRVGGECAKKILGWAPTAKKFSWVTGMKPFITASSRMDGNVTVWKHENGVRGAISVNGYPQTFGGINWIVAEFEKKFAPYMETMSPA